MKKLFCIPLTVFAFFASAQNTATLDSSMRFFKAGNLSEAITPFKRILSSNDEVLKQKAVNTLSEYWLANTKDIKRSQEVADYGNTLIAYMRTLAAKGNLQPADLYTMGVGTWTVISTGTLKQELVPGFLETALNALGPAAEAKYPNASYYMVQVLRRYKLHNKAIPYDDIFAWTDMAVGDRKSVQPILELLDASGNVWYKNELADTSRIVIGAAFNIALSRMPDSLFLVVDRVWKNAKSGFMEDKPVAYLNTVFSQLSANNNAAPLIGKGYAWHLLYKYMYNGDRQNAQQKRDGERAKLLDTIKKVYSTDEKKLALLMGDFIATTKADDVYEFSNMQEVDWMDNIKVPFNGNPHFYRAAVLSGKFYTHLLESDPGAPAYVQTIADAYTERLKHVHNFFEKLDDMPNGYAKIEFKKALLSAVMIDRMNIEKLRSLPAFANNQAMKFHDANASLSYVEIFMLAHEGAPLTQEVDAVIKKLNTITQPEKAKFDFTYLKSLESYLGVLNALSAATANGVEIETINPFTKEKMRSKIYPKQQDAQKKAEVQAELRKFMGS